VFGNDDMLPNNYGYGDGEASAYSGMNEYGAAAAESSYGGIFAGDVQQTAMTPQQDRPKMRVVPNPGEYGYAEFMAERAGIVIPDRSAYGETSEYGKLTEEQKAAMKTAKGVAAMALRQPTVTPSSSADDIKSLQRALTNAKSGNFKLKPSGKAKDGVDGNWGSDTTEKLGFVQTAAGVARVAQTTPEVWAWLMAENEASAKLAVAALKGARLKSGAAAAGGALLEGAIEGFTRTVAPPPAAGDATPVGGGGGGSTSDGPDYVKWGLIAGGVVLGVVLLTVVLRKD
jgi:hypothetical protein